MLNHTDNFQRHATISLILTITMEEPVGSAFHPWTSHDQHHDPIMIIKMLVTLTNSRVHRFGETRGLCAFKQTPGHKGVSSAYLQALRLDICHSGLPRCLQILRHIILQLLISLLYSNIHHTGTESQAAAGMLHMPPDYYTVELGTV